MNLGKILKYIRVFNKKTQFEVGQNLDISRSYISEIESGSKTPSIELLQKYSDNFNISLSTIMLFAEECKKPKNLQKKATKILAKTTLDLLDWICEKEQKIKSEK